MKASTKSHHTPQPINPHQPATTPPNPTKTQSPFIPTLKLPTNPQPNPNSFSKKIYILTDHQDQVVESIPTAKHTFMSQQVEMGGEKGMDRFYTPRKRDDRKEEREKERQKFGIQPDVNSELQNSKLSTNTKGQRSRFYYKAEDYESLDQLEVEPKNRSVKQESKKQEIIKQGVNKSEKGMLRKQQGGKQLQVKKKSVKQQSQRQDIIKKQQQQSPNSNTKMLSSYIYKMNKSPLPFTPLQQQQQTQGSPFKKKPLNQSQPQQQYPQPKHHPPYSSRFSHPLTPSPLQQSHQKLFNKCYKQTYSHLKLMLRQIHQSQEHIHIIHKQITDTVFEVIKERAECIRQEMNQLVQQIVTQWMKDEWEFVKSSEVDFMDDILEVQNQLNHREQQIHSFVDRLINQNNKHSHYQSNLQGQDIYHTFNAKAKPPTILTSLNSSRPQTTWKKVTTDLLMFNYQTKIIQIQQMIEKISKTSLDKCNRAVDMLPSSELFRTNSHEEVLNDKAKRWFRGAVLGVMNGGTDYQQRQRKTRNSPNKDSKNCTPQKTYHKKSPPPSPQYQQYQQIVNSLKTHHQKTSKTPTPYPYYPPQNLNHQQQSFIDKPHHQSANKKQQQASPNKMYLDKSYYASGRGGAYS